MSDAAPPRRPAAAKLRRHVESQAREVEETREDMSKRAMRPRKGDLYVVLNDGQYEMKMLLEKAKVTDEDRNIVAAMLAIAARMLAPRVDQEME